MGIHQNVAGMPQNGPTSEKRPALKYLSKIVIYGPRSDVIRQSVVEMARVRENTILENG